eukprot:CAMPEP_0197657466 /NCGR_PEP_ID=MMETSP1338-20131121/44640_1 /TAXON_ID=43686 ORGANISM="Pelagodinium beii, Strain RCC1491" /NCGR_SAMPLE_ID=MMETSP1338 /ASSEMBLY_ACC=CAM_ASM_000754 /LENGTH=609 /DNA_ID=CAMNT_0043233839 /DNA_START=53 /DNA_END=1882 /DNA_ORIENTATION=+
MWNPLEGAPPEEGQLRGQSAVRAQAAPGYVPAAVTATDAEMIPTLAESNNDEPPELIAAQPADWAQLSLEEAQRFVYNAARAQQEEEWRDTNIDARQIYGAREVQHIYGQQLRHSIIQLLRVRVLAAGLLQRSSAWSQLLPPLAVRVMDFEGLQGSSMDFVCSWQKPEPRPAGLTVCIRKRPLLEFELLGGEWDAVEVMPDQATVLCHDGRLSRSGRQLLMTHRRFMLDRAWSAKTSTETIYADTVQPLTQQALRGSSSTLLCMGQTGTGKTHTICGVIECLAKELSACQKDVEVEFFEIYGKKCLDLLAERKEVFLRSDAEGQVHVRGQRAVRLSSGVGLLEIIDQALKLRASEETERNAASSRSHAICTLRFLGEDAEAPKSGVLRLVDLAGSERNFETTKMTAAQHRESAEINASLSAMKECFRAHAAMQRGEKVNMPFRGSRLTRVLRECFMDAEHRTAVIATVSPAACDVIHTANTLLHATMLAKPLEDVSSKLTLDIPLKLNLKGESSFKDVPVMEWTNKDVLAWLQEAENGRFAHVVVPPNLSGKDLLETSAQGLADLFDGDLRRARVGDEGEAWTVSVEVGDDLGRQIFQAARLAALRQGI